MNKHLGRISLIGGLLCWAWALFMVAYLSHRSVRAEALTIATWAQLLAALVFVCFGVLALIFKRQRIAALIGLGLSVLYLGIPLLWVVEHNWNPGGEFGYFREFNHVKHVLITMPGVRVTNEWQNRDISLEEFGFDLMVDGKPVRLTIFEDEAVRRMSRDSAVVDLKERFAKELSRSPTVR